MQGDTLRRLRLQRGLTQAELGREAGVSGQTINNLERGRSRGTAENLAKLAAVLDTTMEELIGVDTPKVPAPLLSLTEDQRRDLLGLLATKHLPPMIGGGALRRFAELMREAGKRGMDSDQFKAWFRRSEVEDVRAELLPEDSVSLEEQVVGLK